MANYASIKFKVVGTPPSGRLPFLLSMVYPGGNALLSELPVTARANPGEFTIGGSYNQSAINLLDALTQDYTDQGGTEILALPLFLGLDAGDSDAIIITATDYGCSFSAPSVPSWLQLVSITPEVLPDEVNLTLQGITVQAADVADKQYNVRWNLFFDNATYPVELTAPVVKTINNASEAYYDFYRNSPYTNSQSARIEATDADGKVLSINHPTADYIGTNPPTIVEQFPGYTVTAQLVYVPGDYTAIVSYKLNDGTWRSSSVFYNVGAGTHTLYVKDNWGNEQQREITVGTLEDRMIWFASPEQRNYRKATINNPTYTPERINMYVVFPGLNKQVKRSLIPTEVEEDVWEADFDINNLLSGELTDYLEDIEAFTFPSDTALPVKDRTNLMLEFYTDISYTYLDANAEPQETDRTDNSANTHHYAIAGGVDHTMLGYLNQEDKRFDEWLINDSVLRWLSWMPDDMPVHPNQPLRIWLLNNGFISSMVLKCQAAFTDGTQSDVISVPVTSSGFGLFEVACGPDELGLNAIDIAKTLASYQFWIDGLNGALPVTTEVKTLQVDNKTFERNDVLFFPTSLGVHEVMWCHGRRSEQRETSKSQNFKPLTVPNMRKGTIRSRRGTLKHSYSMNTGFFPKSMRHYLADLVSAGEAVLPVDFFLQPVLIGDGKFGFGDDDEDLFAISFEMGVAHENRHYTPHPKVDSPWGSFSDDFNEDFFI
nr:hypothetical protein [uncultured Carboxylicivirga sp.]